MPEAPRNLLTPFRRDKKSDFASGAGEGLLASKVRQTLLTEGATQRSSGELPWRTNFGSALTLLRHQRNDAALKELARVYVRDALRRWMGSVRLNSVRVEQSGNALSVSTTTRDTGLHISLDGRT
ncbi:MAG: GPW/gp25 family protein [Polyangiaceae bacterium]